MIPIMRTPNSSPGKSLTLVRYSSVLPNITEVSRPLRVSMPTDLCLEMLVTGYPVDQQT